MGDRAWRVAVVLLAVAGLVLRLVVLHGRWGAVDSDEAVVGLIAEGFRHRHWRAFYWGQHYAGTIEPGLVALLGATPGALKAVPVVLSAVAAVLTWRVGRRLVDERPAQVAGLLVWVAPAAYVYWATKERGFYWVSLVLGLALVLLAQRLAERPSLVDGALLGFVAGLGFWTSPTVLYFAVPAGVWLVARRRPPVLPLLAAIPAAALGALPWLWHNVGHDWPSLERPPQPEYVGYVDGLGRFLWRTLPMALGLRVPIDESWVAPVVGPVVLVGLGVLLVVWRRPPLLLALGLVAFPFVYAWFPGAWFVGEGRYALFAAPFLALALVVLCRAPWIAAGVAVVSLVLTGVGLDHIGPEPPRHVGRDLAVLRRAGVDHAWADYWAAYRLAFESQGWLVASSAVSSRNDDVHAAVARDRTPAVIYRRGDPRAGAVPGRRVRTPHFDVVLADGPVDPALLP